MIQNQTKIIIKDNSGVLMGRCINAGQQRGIISQLIKIAVLKSKASSRTAKRKTSKRSALQDVLLVQTKKTIHRNDGSTLQFNGNKGVCVSKSGAQLQLGFKRINTAVTVELKKPHRGLSPNLIKLAKAVL